MPPIGNERVKLRANCEAAAQSGGPMRASHTVAGGPRSRLPGGQPGRDPVRSAPTGMTLIPSQNSAHAPQDSKWTACWKAEFQVFPPFAAVYSLICVQLIWLYPMVSHSYSVAHKVGINLCDLCFIVPNRCFAWINFTRVSGTCKGTIAPGQRWLNRTA